MAVLKVYLVISRGHCGRSNLAVLSSMNKAPAKTNVFFFLSYNTNVVKYIIINARISLSIYSHSKTFDTSKKYIFIITCNKFRSMPTSLSICKKLLK